MYQRPKIGETDEDILKLQEEFLKHKEAKDFKLAATVVKAPKDEILKEPVETRIYNPQEHLDNTFEDIPKCMNIGKVVENQSPVSYVSKFKLARGTGFPQAKRRDASLTAMNGKGSLFSQQMKKIKTDNIPMETGGPINVMNLTIKERSSEKMELSSSEIQIPTTSYVVESEAKEEIHKANMDFMSKMSEEEILEEREKLMSTLDPAIIAFLKSKRYHTKHVEERLPSMAEQNKAVENITVEDIQTTSDILRQPDADKWLNFDILETNKLAWMKGVDKPKMKKDDKYEARFDFGGFLLPFIEDEFNEKNRILYHHGEEPGRPGYTLQELFQLCRSSVIQQKIIALNTIANILSLQSSGIYEEIIDIPIEQIFFVIRVCLDENSPATLNASIKALRNLFYYPIDETCLDSLLGFGLGLVQPILPVDDTEKEDDKTVNDQQLAESNLVRCVARTDILVRIRYIFNAVKPSIETVVYCLEILIRLIRDSQFILMQVYKCEGLLDTIITHFVPKFFKQSVISSAYGLPITQAIKFLRILCSRSKFIANKLINKYKVLDSIATYVSNDCVSTNTNGLKLQIESLHLWSVLVNYNLGIDYFKVLQPILLQLLNYHLQKTDANTTSSYVIQGHIAAFLNLISQVAKHDYNSTLPYLQLILNTAVPKWCVQFGAQQEYACGKLQIISSLIHCLSKLIKYKPGHVNVPFDNTYNAVKMMIDSNGFKIVTNNIKSASNILNNYETHKSSSNFKSMEAAIWNASDHVIPVLKVNSCLPFLSVLAEFVNNCEDKHLKMMFLYNENIKTYLLQLQTSDNFYLTSNWFTKIESNLIVNILKTAITVQKEIDTSIFYEIAVKSLSIYNSEQKSDVEYILRNIIFSPQFYPSDVLIQNLDISNESSILKTCLDNINDIFEVYIKVLGLRNNPNMFTTNVCLDITSSNILPIDWIYSPIIVLYANQQENKNPLQEQEQIYIITNCLRWVYIYETYFPALAKMINPTDRFCRLACTFLGSDNLFLIPEIKQLLELCLKHILKTNETDIDFDKTIQGLNNFQDFYTQLLEQYQGVSYGDSLFGNFILIPLAQKYNIKFRKTLWSEYAGIVQIFNVTMEESFCPMDFFLYPEEKDLSILKCYRRALTCNILRKNSIFYHIANHHLNAYAANIKK